MTIQDLIKKLGQYEPDQTVILASLYGDTGNSDRELNEEDIDEIDNFVVITHTKPTE